MRLLRKSEPESGDVFGRWSRRLRASDRAAFAEVFRVLNEPLLRYAWRLTGDEAAAQDIVQDTFLKLWQVRETLDDDRSLKAYLYRIVRNLALNHLRASSQHATPTEDTDAWRSDNDTPVDEVIDAEILDRSMKRWVEDMPERRREAFLLSRNHGLSHEEIAQVMNLTPRTVNTHIVLALKDLRMRIGQLEETSEQR
jgi:RNA polymerase sigma-70 factor (family 1)